MTSATGRRGGPEVASANLSRDGEGWTSAGFSPLTFSTRSPSMKSGDLDLEGTPEPNKKAEKTNDIEGEGVQRTERILKGMEGK